MYSGFDRHWTDWTIAVAVVAALVLLVWFGISRTDGRGRVEFGDAGLESDGLATKREGITMPADAAPSRDVIPRELAPGEAAVYECIQDGHKALSDRPCAPGAVARIVDSRELSTYSPVPVTGVATSRYRSQPASVETPRPTTPNPRQSGQGSRCDAIQEDIDRLNARMRQPYSSQEGEWLRKRWHSLKELYYDEGCGKLDLPVP